MGFHYCVIKSDGGQDGNKEKTRKAGPQLVFSYVYRAVACSLHFLLLDLIGLAIGFLFFYSFLTFPFF